jgi:hypothetical protein
LRKGFRFAGAVREAPALVTVGLTEPHQGSKPHLPLPDKPSNAVLPFTNMSADPEQEYFANGVVEEITTGLSRFRWLFVIAQNSGFTSGAHLWADRFGGAIEEVFSAAGPGDRKCGGRDRAESLRRRRLKCRIDPERPLLQSANLARGPFTINGPNHRTFGVGPPKNRQFSRMLLVNDTIT